MIQNHNIQGQQGRNLTSDKQRNSVIRTFQMLLTAIAMLFTLGVQGAWAETVTATWDFTSSTAACAVATNNQASYASDVDGIVLTTDFSNGGELKPNAGNYAQFNDKAVLIIPVVSTDDVVTVDTWDTEYVKLVTVGGTEYTEGNRVITHTATAGEVSAGGVRVVATGNGYIRSITVVQHPSAEPTPAEIPTFSLTEEQTVISTKTPEGWTAVQLPQIPEITESNAVVVSGLVAEANNTTAIQDALDAVPAEGGMVIIPAGEWLSGPLTIKSKTVLHLCKNTTLKMLPYGTYPEDKAKCLITTATGGSSDVVIEGEDYTSIIDGQGADWWNALESNSSLVRPSGLIRFNKGTRYLVRNLMLQNAPNTNLQLGNSGNASHFTVHDVKIVNPASEDAEATADGFTCNSHNTDGIPVWGPYCNIYKCNISTGDDNVVFDSNSQYCHVWDCDFGRGHGASIGSNTMNVHDILWDNIRFNGTQSGFKIKTDRAKGNELYNITYQNSTMTGVRDILYMDCWYGSSTKPTPGTALEEAAPAKGATTPAWHDITYKNITATNCVYKSSDKNGFPIYFYGLPESHIKNVTLDNVTIEGQKGMFMAYVGENEAQGVTFQNGCNITNVRETSAAAFVQDYSAVHNDDYVTAAEPKSSEKKLLQAVFSNGFDAFIKESDHTVTAYYMQGESEPTLETKDQSEKATTSISGNTITVTAEDGTTQDYALTLTPVAPYTTTGEHQFDGTETWIKTGGAYTTEANSKTYYAWVINKNATDGRVQLGKTRIYFFVGNSDKITLINDRGTSLSSDRAIKVYVNGEEKSTPVSMPKYNSETPASIDIVTGGPAMIEIAANQTSGDTGWGKIIVTPKSEEPEDLVLYDLKTGVGSAEVTTADATVTASTSLVLSNTAGRIKITPKDGEKFKNGDKVDFSGTIGNTSKDYGLKIFAADGTTSAGELKVAGTTSPLKVSGTLTLSADADYIFIGRSGGTTTTMTDMAITRPGSTPDPEPAGRTFEDFEINLVNLSSDFDTSTLPSGVVMSGSNRKDAHGYNNFTLEIPVDGPVKFTVGGCQHQNESKKEAVFSIKDGAELARIDVKTPGCYHNGGVSTWIYNSETPATLIFTGAEYTPYFKAEKCELVKQVTVKYYDADGQTVLATDVVNGGSALAYNATATSNVTVASGKKFRGWKNSDGVVVAEGTTLNADLNLYACVTDIEVATKTSEHTYNLTDSKFLVDEHELISVTNGSFHDAQHGWAFSNGGKVTLSLAGNATITVGNCVYPQNGTTKIIAKNAADEAFGECNAVAASDGATYTFIYEGEAGDVTLNITGGEAYIHSIKITHTGDLTLPKWSDEKNAWTFATKATNQLNAQELLYAMSYVNNQTTHDKTIFIPNGTYDLGTAHNTSIPAGMHLIGESQDGVLIKNQHTEESINATATFQIDGANVTLENMTIKCRAPYTTGDGHNAERGVCVEDCGNGSYYKNVTLDGLQDTYYSNGAAGMKATFDNCIVRGNVDFFCGNGDITVNNSRLQIVTTHTSGGTAIICAPATYTTETQGHVFNNCVVEAATSAVDCVTPGHSSNLKFNLARAWYAGGSATEGKDRTPRVTFKDTEFEIKQAADWGGSIGYAQTEERRVFNVITTGVQFTDEARVIDKTNKPFAYATATDRTDPASVNASNITGGGEYDLETIMEKMEADGGYTVGTTKTINGHKAIVLKSDNTKDANGKETRVPMDTKILTAITNNDIIVLDGSGTSTDFVLSQYIRLNNVHDKTIVGINGARLCTEWYLTDYFKSILENVPTSSGTGVNSASTAEGTGGSIEIIRNGQPYTDNIKEEGEYLTRKNLLEATGDKEEKYRNSGIFYIDHSSNLIIRNFKFIGPGSLDCAGYDLMAVIDGTNHCWVDHCEFVDGMDGNFDITNESDFITVSWCQFRYTDRSYAHQNTNLVGSSDEKTGDRGKLNITFAYNEWGANCRARMPMARFGRIHMLNNYYNCAGNSEYAMNPRIESEFLVEGNYWERGVRRAYNPNGQKAVTWGNNNYYADKAADKAGSSMGSTVTVPYQYSALMLDPHKVPEVITLNGGAKLYQKPYFTTNLGVVDKDGEAPYEYTALLSETEADGLVFSVWAENAHTFQWYKQDVTLDGTAGEWEMIEGENRNTYTYMPKTGVTFNIKCKAFGVSGETESDVLKVTIDGESKPIYTTDLDDTKTVEVVSGSPQILTVNAGINGVTYQWYKSANVDGSGATAITSATDRSYTYNPTATTGEVFYLFCRATNQQGNTDSKIVKVKGIYRDVKFHMYATYDANVKESSVYVEGATHNINKVGTKEANITADSDGCKAEVNRTKDISGLRFENVSTSTHTNPLGISAHFVPTTGIANGDKIEVSINTSSTSSANTAYGFYVCKAAELGTENANVIGTITVNGNALKTQTFTATEAITDLYLIPFVGGTAKNINLANVVVYSGETTRPVDDPVFITDLEEEYKVKVGQRQTLSVEVDENDVQSYQWYKNSTKTTDGATAIDGATSASYEYTAAAEGTEYLYCVVTGKKPDTSITSTIATVIATAASDKEPLIWVFDRYCSDNSIAAGGNANISKSTTTVVSTSNGQELKYVTANNTESRVYNLSNSAVTVDGVTYNSYLYMGGSGKVDDRAFVTPALSGSGTLTIIYHDTAAGTLSIYNNAAKTSDPLATATPKTSSAVDIKLKNLSDTELQLVHSSKCYILGIIWTPNQSIVMEKGIYSTTFTDWEQIAKDANGFDVAVETKDNQELTFKLVGTSVAPKGAYDTKFLDNGNLPNGEGYLKTEADNAYIQTSKLNNVTKVYYRLGSTGSNRGFILSKSTDNGANWTQVASDVAQGKEYTYDINEENVMLKWAYTSAAGKNAFMLDLVIYGMMELTNCEEPTYEESWSGDANEKWNYDFESTTESAHLKYTIDGGAEQTIESNKGRVSVSPGQKISIWAIDTEETLPNSPVVEVTAPAKKATTTPNLTVDVYDVNNHNYPVKISGADAEAKVYYTIDGSEPSASSTLYTGPFTVGQEVTVKAIAVRDHYADSPVLTYTTVAISLPQTETFKTTGAGGNDAEAKGIKNKLNPAEIDGKYISGIDGKTGLKYTINGATDQVDADGTTKINGIQIDVHEGYVITALNFADTYCNTSNKNIRLTRVFVDGVAIPGFEAKTIPNSPKSNFKIENIAATESIVLEIIPDDGVNQARAAISPVYEFVETPVSATVDGVAFTEEQNNALKNDHVVTIDNKLFAENPVIVVTTDKGYEYTLKEDPSGLEGDYTRFFKKFVGQEYVVKVKVNATKSPYITIGEELSLVGGYKVTLTGIDYTKTTPYINIDGKTDSNGDLVWEEYDKDKSYYALKEVNTRSGYTDDQTQTVLYTDPREASCPDNNYEAGKPFAVYLYVNGYSDNQVGTHAYNNESFKTDKIYTAVANQFNVIPLAVDNSKSILDYRTDINDAKLVVITESLGGSGSVEIAGVGNKSNMMALTLKRDVLDKTNVLNLKMFLNGSSSANNQRWQWAQPRAMASELTSIMPCTPDGGGMYEIFGNATMSRDASINLWDDINTENMLYHLQPVFNFNEDNESRPNFTPLALVIDPEEPEDQREQYHAIHFYEKNGFQYIAFGLSINEWTQYDNNVYAIIDKIGEMIKAGKSLDSKLEGIVEPKITDNGDGSANVMNNNLNADTYYVVYNKTEYEALNGSVPTADYIISNGTKANDTDFHTQKFTEKMYIFAASKLGADAKSKVVEGSVEGNSIRYVIRENEDPAAQGTVAKYPFDLTVNSGTFNMPYNQSWKKDGYTVTAWEVTKSSDPARVGTTIKPGDAVSGLTQDITVKAIWTENTHKITDLSNSESKEQRTVTWEFLQSNGAPALALENKAGNMQAILVGQAKFKDGTFIDVPMTINTDNLATLPDNGTEYHGKFNNTSVNWAKSLTDGDKEYTGSDYAQVRTGTQFTFPAVYGMNVIYKQVDLVEAVNGEANGNVNRSQVSQSYITDGTKTDDALKTWRFVNPGYELVDGKIVMVDGKAQLAKTSTMYELFKAKGQALGLYDETNGGNDKSGGLIYYQGEGTEATLTSMESAQYIHVGATTGKPLGGLNYGSVFMQSLSVVYPELYDLNCTVVAVGNEGADATKSEYDENDELAKIELFSNTHKNAAGRYFLGDKVKMKFTPAYGYEVKAEDVNKEPEDADDPNYTFIKNGDTAFAQDGMTIQRYLSLDADGKTANDAKAIEAEDRIPSDGAIVDFKMTDLNLTFSVKKVPSVKYNVVAYPSTLGYITFNSGNGRPHKDEYKEFPEGKTIYVTAHPNTGYKFKEWRRNAGDGELIKDISPAIPHITFGDGKMVNPFDPTDLLETNELMFVVGTDNHGNDNEFTYVAVFEEGKTGTGYYEFDKALLQTSEGQDHTTMQSLPITSDDKNKFPTEFESKALNIPEYYTLFKPGYTLDHWVVIKGDDNVVDGKNVFTPTVVDGKYQYDKIYKIGTFYPFEEENEKVHLIPVFTKNITSYDYRATPVEITWDLRVAENAQRMTFKPGVDGTTATTKIYYSTHAKINGGVVIDVPLTVTLGKKGKLVNDIEEEDKWCAMGEGTQIEIPSGLGAKFTIASLSKMETTTIDGVVPTSYTVERIDDADVYIYTYTTTSEATSVTLKIGDDYTYYKYIRAELPSADAVPLTVTENNAAFGTVEIAKVCTTADAVDANNTELLAKINDTKESVTVGGVEGDQYTLGLGTIVSLHAKRSHLYVLDYFEDGDGNKYYYNKNDDTKHLTVMDKDGKDITADATAVDEYLKMKKVQDFNEVTSLNDIQLTFQVQSYSESMHAVYKENTLYQVNYTSGDEAEGEAPGMTLVEDGESFTVPAENHHLYVDGQTLRYWVDEDGNKYDLGQSYTLGQTFTASKDMPSGITSGSGFTVPKKDIFLTPVFKVNDFTVMNLDATATAKWPLSRKGGAGYEGNGDIVINFEGINGIYVTPLKVTHANGKTDFIDLKMDIRGENGKANNVNSTDRCQVNSGTVFGLPSSSNCTITLKSANSSISTKIDGVTAEGQQTVSSNYTGDKTQIDVQFTGNTYLYEVVAQYKPVTTNLPQLSYATVGNISLGALGTPLEAYRLSVLKSKGEISGVPADLSNSTTGVMPVVRGSASLGGYVEVTQATIDNPVATMLVKTQDGVTVSVYKIGFTVTYPTTAPRVTDLKVDRKYQCDLKKMYDNAIADTRVDGTNYINDNAYLKHLGVDGDRFALERVGVNGVINIKFSNKMAETEIPAATFQPLNGKATLGQTITAVEGQTLTFTYRDLEPNTEYYFEIPAGTFKDVFWAESTEANKANHVYNEPIRIHFTTVETAIATEHRVVNYVVTHNQASHFDVAQGKMVADGDPVQVASDDLIKNLKAADIPYGTLDDGVKLANEYKEAGKRFYIFVPDGKYQLMGNEAIKSLSSDPIGEDGKSLSLGSKTNVYNGITTISHDNVSITGQSQEKTIVFNHPAFEGLSYASTLKLNGGIANFYAQDMTLQNQFDFLRCRKVSSKAVAPVIWDRSQKPIFKNVKFDSYQDTYYTNANSQFDDTRGYLEDCTIMGYVDFICGDGDHWFQNCNMVVRQGVGSTATNMFAARQYDTQKWGYIMNKCTFSAENNTAFDVNNGKMTIARPWANSPAETLIECKYDVLSTDDGYKKMTGGGLVLRMQEYKSYDSDGTILDLSKRSLRNSTPGIGSYDAVMTPSKAAEYNNLFNVMGGEDGYAPTLYTRQVNMTGKLKQDDTSLTWDEESDALCYFVFRKDNETDTEWKLFAVTDGTEYELDDNQINKWFCVRAANQRGGLGEATEAYQYKAHESYKRALVNNNQVIDGWRWSTIYLDFNAKAPVVQHEENIGGETKMVDDIYVYALVKLDATRLYFQRVKTMEKNCGYLIKARPRPEDYVFKYTEKEPLYYTSNVGDGMTLEQYRDSLEQYRDSLKAKGITVADQPVFSLMNGSVVDRSATGIAGYTLSSKTSYGLGFYKYVGKTYNAYFAWLDAEYVAEAQKALAEGPLDNGADDNEQAAAKTGFMKMVFNDDLILEKPEPEDPSADLEDPSVNPEDPSTDPKDPSTDLEDPSAGKDDDVSDIKGIRDHNGDDEIVIYNLSGQRVDASMLVPGQVYVINGNKVRY